MWKSYKINKYIDITDMYSLFLRYYDEGYRFEGEMHNFWECLYVVEGSMFVTADERIHNLKKGDMIFHKPLEMHKFFTDNIDGVTLFIFSFSAEGEFSDSISNRVFRLNQSQDSIISSLIDYYKSSLKRFPQSDLPVFNRPLELFKSDPLFSQTVSTNITQLILSLAENGTSVSHFVSKDSELFKNAVDYMNSNINTSFAVWEMAEFLNISVSGLKRLFSKYSGISVHKYFLTLKIKTATELLQNGEKVGEVAEKLGFSSQAYFSAVYKRETGITPSNIKI